jgi:predicted ribosomally synthesized peptide with SipW-like signal peptide
MIRHKYFSAMFLSGALFNIVMAFLLIFLFDQYLLLVDVGIASSSDSMSNMFRCLFGFVVGMFGFVYAWIGCHLMHPASPVLAIIAAALKLGVFLIMSTYAYFTDVAWLSGPLFSIVDFIYSLLFVEYFVAVKKQKSCIGE